MIRALGTTLRLNQVTSPDTSLLLPMGLLLVECCTLTMLGRSMDPLLRWCTSMHAWTQIAQTLLARTLSCKTRVGESRLGSTVISCETGVERTRAGLKEALLLGAPATASPLLPEVAARAAVATPRTPYTGSGGEARGAAWTPRLRRGCRSAWTR